MKKILSLCAVFSFPLYVCLPFTESFSSNEVNKKNNGLDMGLLAKNRETYSLQSGTDGSTNIVINYNDHLITPFLKHKGKGADVADVATDERTINFDNYFFAKDQVLDKISFTFDLTNSYVISYEQPTHPKNKYMEILQNPVVSLDLPNENATTNFNVGSAKYWRDDDIIQSDWSINIENVNNKSLRFHVLMHTVADNEGNPNKNTAALGYGVLFFNKVTINVPYSLDAIRNNIASAFKNYTLPYTSSTATTVLGNAGATNRSEIEAILRKRLSTFIPLGLYDSLNPQMWFTETPEKFINFKMVFVDPNTKKNNDASLWTWNVPIKFSLSPDYWQKSFWSRLSLSPGKISDASGIKLVDDTLEVIDAGQGVDNGYNGGHILYHTTTSLSFFELKNNDNDDDYDSLSVNGIKLNGIDGQYQYNLIDNSVGDATGKKTSDYITTFLVRT